MCVCEQDTILASKDLDLPTQKEMLAIYRCDEISETAFRRFAADAESLKQQLLQKSAPLTQLGKTLADLLEKCMGSLPHRTLMYSFVHTFLPFSRL